MAARLRVRDWNNEVRKEMPGRNLREPLVDVQNSVRVTRSQSLRLGLAGGVPSIDKENDIVSKGVANSSKRRTTVKKQDLGVKREDEGYEESGNKRGRSRQTRGDDAKIGNKKEVISESDDKDSKNTGDRVGRIRACRVEKVLLKGKEEGKVRGKNGRAQRGREKVLEEEKSREGSKKIDGGRKEVGKKEEPGKNGVKETTKEKKETEDVVKKEEFEKIVVKDKSEKYRRRTQVEIKKKRKAVVKKVDKFENISVKDKDEFRRTQVEGKKERESVLKEEEDTGKVCVEDINKRRTQEGVDKKIEIVAKKEVEDQKVSVEDVDEKYRKNRKDPINIYLETEYTKDIYLYLRQEEDNYQLKRVKDELEDMRAEILDWMVYAHNRHGVEELGHGAESLHLAFYLVDRWVEERGEEGVHVASLAALVVAAKWHERRRPKTAELCRLAGDVSVLEVQRAEAQVLAVVGWRLGRPDPMTFLRRWSLVAGLDRRGHAAAKFLLEVGLLAAVTAPLPPSLLSSAAVFLTLCLLGGPNSDHWTPALITNAYPLSEVSPPASLLSTVALRASFSRSFVSLVEKYTTDPFQTSVYIFKGIYLCNLMYMSNHKL